MMKNNDNRVLCPFCKTVNGVKMFSYNYGKGILAYCTNCEEKFTQVTTPVSVTDDLSYIYDIGDIFSNEDIYVDGSGVECSNTCCCCDNSDDNVVVNIVIEGGYYEDDECGEEIDDEEGTLEEYKALYIEALETIWGMLKENEELKEFNTQCIKELNTALDELGY